MQWRAQFVTRASEECPLGVTRLLGFVASRLELDIVEPGALELVTKPAGAGLVLAGGDQDAGHGERQTEHRDPHGGLGQHVE